VLVQRAILLLLLGILALTSRLSPIFSYVKYCAINRIDQKVEEINLWSDHISRFLYLPGLVEGEEQ
jgi:hypothetical protein